MLERVDLTQFLTKEDYERRLIPLQEELLLLQHELYIRRRAMVMVFEGWDAAGKGGAIRRITERLDSRGYEVFPIAAPAGEDRTHHYLYRFWRRLLPPQEKQIQIFDRSWYGRVMVERIEGFCAPNDWKRAYREINEFEHQLVSAGFLLAKFWLHISPEEQQTRFTDRQNTAEKSWKLTDEDWRNREKWAQYQVAVEDMLVKTSTITAPWTIVEANDKYFARIRVLETIVNNIKDELKIKITGKKKK